MATVPLTFTGDGGGGTECYGSVRSALPAQQLPYHAIAAPTAMRNRVTKTDNVCSSGRGETLSEPKVKTLRSPTHHSSAAAP